VIRLTLSNPFFFIVPEGETLTLERALDRFQDAVEERLRGPWVRVGRTAARGPRFTADSSPRIYDRVLVVARSYNNR